MKCSLASVSENYNCQQFGNLYLLAFWNLRFVNISESAVCILNTFDGKFSPVVRQPIVLFVSTPFELTNTRDCAMRLRYAIVVKDLAAWGHAFLAFPQPCLGRSLGYQACRHGFTSK